MKKLRTSSKRDRRKYNADARWLCNRHVRRVGRIASAYYLDVNYCYLKCSIIFIIARWNNCIFFTSHSHVLHVIRKSRQCSWHVHYAGCIPTTSLYNHFSESQARYRFWEVSQLKFKFHHIKVDVSFDKRALKARTGSYMETWHCGRNFYYNVS